MMVTIGIPTYNNERYIRECIESCLKQGYKDYEILVVDDGSTDNTSKILKEYDIRVIRNEKNMGIGYSRNVIIDNANGDAILFLSSDDKLLRYSLGSFVNYLKRHMDSFIYSDYFIINEYGKRLQLYSINEMNYIDFVNACIDAARQHRMFVTYNIIATKEMWKKIRFRDDKRIGEDLFHLLEALLVYRANFVHIPFPLYEYRVHPGMQTRKRANEIVANNEDTFRRINEMLGAKVI
ncbi:MAG: glycosyltransferase family 2 protein [Candidatus Aenigmatarchaeota archaeon]